MVVLEGRTAGVAQEGQEVLVVVQVVDKLTHQEIPEQAEVRFIPMVLVVHLFGMDMVKVETELIILVEKQEQLAVFISDMNTKRGNYGRIYV